MKRVCLGLVLCLLLGAGCSPATVFQDSPDSADYAFVRSGELYYVNQDGTVVETGQVASAVQPVVLPSGEAVVFAEAISDQYVLSVYQVTTKVTNLVVPLPALPTAFVPSFEDDLLAVLADTDLFLVFVGQQRMIRVHEGVLEAEFTSSHQRIVYRTSDGRSLGRDFSADGLLQDVQTMDYSFTEVLADVPSDAQMAGWSRAGDTVYYVTSTGTVTRLE